MTDDRAAWEKEAQAFVLRMSEHYGLRTAVVCTQLDDTDKPPQTRVAINYPAEIALFALQCANKTDAFRARDPMKPLN